jgi:hypothetical protein
MQKLHPLLSKKLVGQGMQWHYATCTAAILLAAILLIAKIIMHFSTLTQAFSSKGSDVTCAKQLEDVHTLSYMPVHPCL